MGVSLISPYKENRANAREIIGDDTKFFEKAEKEILSKEEEQEMLEQFQSISAIAEKVTSLLEDIDYLEEQDWAK